MRSPKRQKKIEKKGSPGVKPWDTLLFRGAALPGMSYRRGCFLEVTEPAQLNITGTLKWTAWPQSNRSRVYTGDAFLGFRVKWTL